MRARLAIVVGLLVSLAGCAGHQTQTMARTAHFVRPAKPIWCPINVPGNRKLQRGRFDARALLGLSRNQAEAKAARHQCESRVVKIDGRGLILTADYDTRRVDLTLQHNVVTGVGVG